MLYGMNYRYTDLIVSWTKGRLNSIIGPWQSIALGPLPTLRGIKI